MEHNLLSTWINSIGDMSTANSRWMAPCDQAGEDDAIVLFCLVVPYLHIIWAKVITQGVVGQRCLRCQAESPQVCL